MADYFPLRAIHGHRSHLGSCSPGKKEQNMKSLKNLVVASIFAALACSGLHAQSVNLRATIPFDFHAGKTLLPAGEYLIHSDGPVVWLGAGDHSKPASAVMTIGAAASLDSHQQARVEFNRYGDEFFLSSIWNPST